MRKPLNAGDLIIAPRKKPNRHRRCSERRRPGESGDAERRFVCTSRISSTRTRRIRSRSTAKSESNQTAKIRHLCNMACARRRIVRERHKQIISACLPNKRLNIGELFADIIADHRSPPIFHCVVQRQDSPEILFLGQYRSCSEAETAARDFMSDYQKQQQQEQQRMLHDVNSNNVRVTRLRIESGNGSPVNDYRIRNGIVEFLAFDPSTRPHSDSSSEWRSLDDDDIEVHHSLGTVVSKWLQVRLGGEPPDLKNAA